MKSPYVSELQPNQTITATFLVHAKDIRQKKTGDPYLSLVLGDRTGELDAKMWDNVAEVLEAFQRDDFVRVKGMLAVHQNRVQLTVHKLAKVGDQEIDFADYFPCSERDPEEMFAELLGIAAGVQNTHLRALLESFLRDEKISRPYRLAPAAKSVHHAYLSGLIEHVLSMCSLARMTASHYKDIDLDLLLTGVILHDIGKIAELTYDRSFGYTSEGQLIGHIMMGVRMLHQKIAELPGFPPRLCTLVEHMILSHHGALEFGSPKLPAFPEALLLHHLDNMDSKMECMRSLIAKDRHAEGCWTGYSVPLERAVLKKLRYLEMMEAAPLKAPAVTPPASQARPQTRPSASSSLFGDKLQQALRRE